jgi:hypothetical protein
VSHWLARVGMNLPVRIPETCGLFRAKQVLPKSASGHILRPLTCPPFSKKVSQVEMEAGDCEGRLPPLFYVGLRPWSLVFGLRSLIFSKE